MKTIVENINIPEVDSKNYKYTFLIPIHKNYKGDVNEKLTHLLDVLNNPDIETIVITNKDVNDIVSKYSVTHIKTANLGIGELINIGLFYAHGPVVFINSIKSIPTNDRILVQVDELETCDISVCSSNNYQYDYQPYLLNKYVPFYCDCIAFKRQSVVQHAIWFEEYFADTARKFLMTMFQRGLEIKFTNKVLIESEQDDTQNDTETEKVIRCYVRGACKPNLTCIVPFRNEGVEVEKTVQSIRATASDVSIILINDNSKDAFDYEDVAIRYGCKYIEHSEPIGCGASRDEGVSQCDTEFFILLDSHMRFYNMDWDIRIVELLKKYPESIICSQTSVIEKNENSFYINENGKTSKVVAMGSKFNTEDSRLFDVKWTNNILEKTDEPKMNKVVCVLGAGYCSSVKWWNYIKGLSGLHIYGLDEGLMSFKTWCYGGTCYILDDFVIGHVYREKSPFVNRTDVLESNRIFCYNAYLDEFTKRRCLDALKERLGTDLYNKAEKIYSSRSWLMEECKKDFKQKKKHDITWFLKLNEKV